MTAAHDKNAEKKAWGFISIQILLSQFRQQKIRISAKNTQAMARASSKAFVV